MWWPSKSGRRRFIAERDERIGSLTDEAVDEFYSCALCQSFAPNHICIITPERSSLRCLQLARRQSLLRDQLRRTQPTDHQRADGG